LKFGLAAFYHMQQWTKQPASGGDSQGWQIRSLARQELRGYPETVLTESEHDALSDVIGRLSVSMLYSSHRLDSLIAAEGEHDNVAIVEQHRFLRYLGYRTPKPRFGYAPLRSYDFGDLDVGDMPNDEVEATMEYLRTRKLVLAGPRISMRKSDRFIGDPDLAPRDEFLVLQGQSAMSDLSVAQQATAALLTAELGQLPLDVVSAPSRAACPSSDWRVLSLEGLVVG
jgi:hypothetical protein